MILSQNGKRLEQAVMTGEYEGVTIDFQVPPSMSQIVRYTNAMRNGNIGDAMEVMTETVKNWKGVVDEEGKSVPWSSASMESLCCQYPDFWKELCWEYLAVFFVGGDLKKADESNSSPQATDGTPEQ